MLPRLSLHQECDQARAPSVGQTAMTKWLNGWGACWTSDHQQVLLALTQVLVSVLVLVLVLVFSPALALILVLVLALVLALSLVLDLLLLRPSWRRAVAPLGASGYFFCTRLFMTFYAHFVQSEWEWLIFFSCGDWIQFVWNSGRKKQLRCSGMEEDRRAHSGSIVVCPQRHQTLCHMSVYIRTNQKAITQIN